MIKVTQGVVEYSGDIQDIISECAVALKATYELLKKNIDEDFANEWVDDVSRTVRMTKEELMEEVWNKIMEMGDDDV